MREIADIIKISTKDVRNILNKYLYTKKLCAIWVPHFLTIDQKLQHDDSECISELFQCNQIEFLCRFIIMDEKWIHPIADLQSDWNWAKVTQRSQENKAACDKGKGALSSWQMTDMADLFYEKWIYHYTPESDKGSAECLKNFK